MHEKNDRERLVRKHIRHLVLNARDLPAALAFDLALVTGSSVGNVTSLALLRHFLAFISIRWSGQRTSGIGDEMFPQTPRYRVHEEMTARTGNAIGPYEDLLTSVKRRKLKWYGHVTQSSEARCLPLSESEVLT